MTSVRTFSFIFPSLLAKSNRYDDTRSSRYKDTASSAQCLVKRGYRKSAVLGRELVRAQLIRQVQAFSAGAIQIRITSESFRSSPATSPPTEAIPLSEAPCAAARTHARPAHTNASRRER